ncbi:hypothetical protein CEXT_167571 [Caerostris extrusa]|uniref:Uncharacterized protein n=1 Tax=Caerostris extrusa TaxID=172846 RepID=A0AAV4Y6D0_CAEEX|nr:hypothetical protein CEXT_167571 [Caerostris extrusa]
MVDNFFRTTKEASVQSDFEPEKICFDKFHNRYNKPVQAKENSERLRIRASGIPVDTHTFLVKAYSTFGVGTERAIPLSHHTDYCGRYTVLQCSGRILRGRRCSRREFSIRRSVDVLKVCCNTIRPTAFLREHDI